jgi:trigger factor
VVRFDIKPNFKLGDVRGHQVDPYETAATDQDVDNALNEIANQKRAIKTVDGPAADGDFLKADLTFQDSAGQTVLERKNVQLNTRIPFAGVDAEAFAKAAIGAAAGATLTVELTFADNFEKEAVRGQAGKLQIHVHEVLRVQPAPIDDNLARQFEFDDLAALKEDLRQRISGEKERVGRLRQEDQVLEALLGAHSFDLPPSLVDEQQRASLQQFAHRLKQNGAGEDEIQKKLEEAQGEAQTDAQRRVKLFFLIESIARQEQIQITEADLTQELHNIAAQNNATPEQVFEYLQKNNQLSEMRLAVLERKVRDFLRENARVADKKG